MIAGCRKKDGVRVGDERTDKLQSRERPMKGREKKSSRPSEFSRNWVAGQMRVQVGCKYTFAASSRVVASSRFDRSRYVLEMAGRWRGSPILFFFSLLSQCVGMCV